MKIALEKLSRHTKRTEEMLQIILFSLSFVLQKDKLKDHHMSVKFHKLYSNDCIVVMNFYNCKGN